MSQRGDDVAPGTVVRLELSVNIIDITTPWKIAGSLSANSDRMTGSAWVTPFRDPRGHYLFMTCWHVIQQTSRVGNIKAQLDEDKFYVTVFAGIPSIDACLLQLETPHLIPSIIAKLKPWSLASAFARKPKDACSVVGFPLGEETIKFASVTFNGPKEYLMQFDGSINQGHSGAPVSYQNKVIGWVSEGVVDANNVSYARPLELFAAQWPRIAKFIQQEKEGKTRFRIEHQQRSDNFHTPLHWMLIHLSDPNVSVQPTTDSYLSTRLRKLSPDEEWLGIRVRRADPEFSPSREDDLCLALHGLRTCSFDGTTFSSTPLLGDESEEYVARIHPKGTTPLPSSIYGGMGKLSFRYWFLFQDCRKPLQVDILREQEYITYDMVLHTYPTFHTAVDNHYFQPGNADMVRRTARQTPYLPFPLHALIKLELPFEQMPYVVTAGVVVAPLTSNYMSIFSGEITRMFSDDDWWQYARHSPYLLVTKILSGSPAARDEILQSGEVLDILNGVRVRTLADYIRVLHDTLDDRIASGMVQFRWRTLSNLEYLYQASRNQFELSENQLQNEHSYASWLSPISGEEVTS